MSQQTGGPNQSFLDRGTVVALALVAVVWFGWSKWVEKTYPTPAAPIAQTETAAAPAQANSAGTTTTAVAKSETGAAVAPVGSDGKPVVKAEALLDVGTPSLGAKLSSRGMGFRTIELKPFRSRDEKPIVIGMAEAGIGATGLIGGAQTLDFTVSASADGTEYVGTADVGPYKVEKKIRAYSEGDAKGKAFEVITRAHGNLADFKGFSVRLEDEVKAPVSGSMFAPSTEHNDWYVRYEDTKKRVVINPEKPEALDAKNVFSVALSSHYFTSAIADRSDLHPSFKSPGVEKHGDNLRAGGVLEYAPISEADEFTIKQVVYLGAKDVDILRAADPELARVVDYGMFAVLAEPLLWLLRFFHNLFGNWGFAIIGLTLVVRAVVMPFNIYSFKSMKVMQKLQPQIQSVRERYKEDPRRMNEEVMRLMRENKANPLGGCLPMLLQLPVFFALYQVLASSIELYQQPFIFWIHDLSIKDPFYVLPVLMGISMFVQQKITPVADPQQAKILQWMPVLFSFMMISLPSGLTLYIFVSTLFGIAQQYVFMRDRSASQPQKTVQQAKA